MVRLFAPIRSRLLYKMLIVYSLLTLVPLIVVSTTFYVRSSQLLDKNATEDAQRELSAVAASIDAPLFAIKKRMLELAEQDSIEDYLKTEPAAEGRQLKLRDNAMEVLQIELEEAKRKIGAFVDNVYLVAADDRVIGTDERLLQFASAFRLLPFEFDRMPEWAFFTDYKRMACDMKIFAKGTDEVIGQLVVTLAPAALQQSADEFDPGTFYITNSENVILSASIPDEIGSVLDVRGPATQLLIQQKSQYADFHYLRLASPGTGGIVKKQAIFAAAITLFAWLAVFFATYFILKRITNPIQRLTRLMRRAEQEEYQLMHQVRNRDEIAMLCHGYNRLVQRTKELIDKNYKNELLVKEAELHAIRMYINPHFLYNTLEYISIVSGNPDKAKFVPKIVQKLGSIFRFSIMPGEALVPLETELSFVEKYLQIHSYRFGDRMRYSIAMPAMLRQAAVPKLLLQPLVENAVVHGIDHLPEGGRIDIDIREVSYELVIEIRNSAPAETDGKLEDLKPPARKGLGSGLENVNRRIRHHFGNVYGVGLSRREDNTVSVILHMPIQLWTKWEGN